MKSSKTFKADKPGQRHLVKVVSYKKLNNRDDNVNVSGDDGSKFLKVGLERTKLIGGFYYCTYRTWNKTGQMNYYVNQDNEWQPVFIEEAILADNQEQYKEFINVWSRVVAPKGFSERKSFYDSNMLFDSSYENYLMRAAKSMRLDTDMFSRQRNELRGILGMKRDDCFRLLSSDVDFLQLFDKCTAFIYTMIADEPKILAIKMIPNKSWSNITSRIELDYKDIMVRWNEFKINPYKLVYKWVQDSDKIKPMQREHIDEMFTRKDENMLSDIRIEYMLYDCIHFERRVGNEMCTAFKNLCSCYELRNGRVRNGLVDEVSRRFKGKIGKKTQSDLDSAVFHFLKRVKDGIPFVNCSEVIKYDSGYYYDENILKKEILTAEKVVQVATSDEDSLEEQWDKWYNENKSILDKGLSVEQLSHLGNMISKPFSAILGSAGTGKV
jgi:hypothetical protein